MSISVHAGITNPEITKMLNALWEELGPERQLEYTEKAAAGKAAYKQQMRAYVPPQADPKTCRCGSETHRRTTHGDCLLNLRNSASGVAAPASKTELAIESSGTPHLLFSEEEGKEAEFISTVRVLNELGCSMSSSLLTEDVLNELEPLSPRLGSLLTEDELNELQQLIFGGSLEELGEDNAAQHRGGTSGGGA
jgi:hypothetical protein